MADYPASLPEIQAFYAQSHRLVRFLSTKGKDRLLLLFDKLGQGAAVPSALASVYPDIAPGIAQLDRVFRPYATGESD